MEVQLISFERESKQLENSLLLYGLQAGAPEGACHDNVKSLEKKYHSTVGLSFTNIQ